MIDAALWRADGHTVGFRISGHAGYEDSGKDIVCAAVSSAMQLTANGITEILHYEPVLKVEESAVTLQTKRGCDDQRVLAMLDSLRLQLEILAEQYPQFIQIHILEV